jgi:hypothetical protein
MSIKDRMKAMGGAAMVPFGVKPPTAKIAPVAVVEPAIPTAKDGGLSDSLLERYAGNVEGDGELTRNKTSSRASIRLGARRQPTKRSISVDEEVRSFSILGDSDGLEADMAAAMAAKSEEDL